MKKVLITLILLIPLCAYAVDRTHIKIQQTDEVYYFGQVKFVVNEGDVLEVIRSKTCRRGGGECWEVRNVKTGATGFVEAEKMKNRHHIYSE